MKITITFVGFYPEEKQITVNINENETIEDLLRKTARNLKLEEEIFCEEKICPWIMIIADEKDITSLNLTKERASKFKEIKIFCLL